MCHVRPLSRLYMMAEWGMRSASMYCVGNTRVPSLMVMPRPGP